MNHTNLKENISFTIAISSIFAISITHLMDPSLTSESSEFAILISKFYGISIVSLILLYVVLQTQEFPNTLNEFIKWSLLFNLLLMAFALFILMFPNQGISFKNGIMSLVLIFSFNIGIPVFLSGIASLYSIFKSTNDVIRHQEPIKFENLVCYLILLLLVGMVILLSYFDLFSM